MKTEDKIIAAFDTAEPLELDELLDGIKTDAGAFRTRRIRRAALAESGLVKSGRARPLPGMAKRLIAAAAVLLIVFGVSFGVTAYAKEAKEYNEAVQFFKENDLPIEGLTRSEVKSVYRDVTIYLYPLSEMRAALENGEYDFSGSKAEYHVSGVEFHFGTASPDDYSVLWSGKSFDSLRESENVYAASLCGGLVSLDDGGVHYEIGHEYSEEAGVDGVGSATLTKFERGEEVWKDRFDYSTIDVFEVFDDCVVIAGMRGKDPARGIGFIARHDDEGLRIQHTGSSFDSRRVVAIAENGDGSFTLFTREFDGKAYSIRMLRYSHELEPLSEAEVFCPEGYYAVRAVRYGEGYALLLQASFWDWSEQNGEMVRQLVEFTDADGNVTNSLPAALDTVAREALEARDTEGASPDDPAAMLSIDLEDSCFVITDMAEYGGKLFFSGYALPKGGYTYGDEPNPSSHHDEITPLITGFSVFGMTDAEFTELVRANYTALLIEFDPIWQKPTALYLEAGALGNALRFDVLGRLTWNVCSIRSAVFSPATSSFSVKVDTAVAEYKFNRFTDSVHASDTGARTTILR